MCLWNKCLSSSELETLFTEDTSGSGVYLKNNGSWTEAQAIYQKNNGAWIQITESELLELVEGGTKLVKGES